MPKYKYKYNHKICVTFTWLFCHVSKVLNSVMSDCLM